MQNTLLQIAPLAHFFFVLGQNLHDLQAVHHVFLVLGDIIAHIYSLMPLNRLIQGYKRYVNDIYQNYGLRRR